MRIVYGIAGLRFLFCFVDGRDHVSLVIANPDIAVGAGLKLEQNVVQLE